MTDTAQTPEKLPIFLRIFFAVPIIGWVCRDITLGDSSNAGYATLAFVCTWAISILQFGVVGLYIPALFVVPMVLGFMLWYSRP